MNIANRGKAIAKRCKIVALDPLVLAEKEAARRFSAWVRREYPEKPAENLAAELDLKPRQGKNLVSGRVLPKIGHIYRFAAGKASRGAKFLHHVLVEPFTHLTRTEARPARRVATIARSTIKAFSKIAHREYRGAA